MRGSQMIDFKLLGIIMLVIAIVSIQYSLNVIVRLLKEIIQLLNLLNMKDK